MYVRSPGIQPHKVTLFFPAAWLDEQSPTQAHANSRVCQMACYEATAYFIYKHNGFCMYFRSHKK